MKANRHMRGFSLVEIMVGMVIGLLGILVILQVFAVSEGQKRNTTSGSDAQSNGGVALFQIEREVRKAGYGLVRPEFLACPSINIWNADLGKVVSLNFTPFQINPPGIPAGDPNTDVIWVAYSGSDVVVEGTGVDQPAGPSVVLQVDNRFGYNQGDIAVGVQTLADGTVQCTGHEITVYPGGQCGQPPSGQSNNLIANPAPSNYNNFSKGCQKVNASRNRPGGIAGVEPLSKIGGAMLFNLGSAPIVSVYAVRGGNLTVCDGFVNDCTDVTQFTPIVSDIVSLRAVYGRDVDANGIVDDGEWTGAAARIVPTATQWNRLAAARVAVVARNTQPEKPDAMGNCIVTTDATKPDKQTWLGDSVAGAGFNLATSKSLATTRADWNCYRYKLFQTVIPLRNLIWLSKT